MIPGFVYGLAIAFLGELRCEFNKQGERLLLTVEHALGLPLSNFNLP